MNRPPRVCIFCGRPGNMSDQHIFPDRLKRVLPRVHGIRQYGTVDHRRRGRKTVFEQRTKKENQGSIGTSRVRRVCRPCNEGWLNAMEQDCFPVVEQILKDETTSLTKDRQARLARLALSISMVGEWLSEVHVATTQRERDHFQKCRTPPPGWYVFVGRNASGLVSPFRHADGMRSVIKGGEGTRLFATHTMAMGPVLLHVICLPPDDFFDVDKYARLLGLAVIYPETEWIAFPLLPALDTGSIARVSSYARETFRALTTR
jgi:hypothetical protein